MGGGGGTVAQSISRHLRVSIGKKKYLNLHIKCITIMTGSELLMHTTVVILICQDLSSLWHEHFPCRKKYIYSVRGFFSRDVSLPFPFNLTLSCYYSILFHSIIFWKDLKVNPQSAWCNPVLLHLTVGHRPLKTAG